MTLDQRIEALAGLAKAAKTVPDDVVAAAHQQNPWFTPANQRLALDGILRLIDADALRQWTRSCPLDSLRRKQVAVVMAGNIPLVGFHDFLTVLIAGHELIIKASHKDNVLLPYLAGELTREAPELGRMVRFEDHILTSFDAVIATGSDNSARYFRYYFRNKPAVIRKNRTSLAILTGKESRDERLALGRDVFSYFGLGCRNVSKLFVPRGYDFQTLFGDWNTFSSVITHSKYANNFDYHKSILLVNGTPHLDTGFLLLTESTALVSPVAMLYYEYYDDEGQLPARMQQEAGKIQCIVGALPVCTVRFGETQSPAPWDYADNLNTLEFLSALPG